MLRYQWRVATSLAPLPLSIGGGGKPCAKRAR